MSKNKVGVATAILDESIKRDETDTAFAQQVRQRSHRKGVKGVHEIGGVTHPSRKQEIAAAQEIEMPPERSWQRPSALPGVPRLAGFYVQYIRRDNRNHGDCANMLASLRSGWELCRVQDFPAANLPTNQLTRHGEVIGNDDTVLMKIPERLWRQRNAHYNAERERATEAISGRQLSVEVEHPAMPIVDAENRSSADKVRSKVRRNRSVHVAGD